MRIIYNSLKKYWPVAQGLERHPYKVDVVGSIPTGPTKFGETDEREESYTKEA